MAKDVFDRIYVFVEDGIENKLNPNDNVKNLSGGGRQAIAIARAEYFGARLLILDEPTSALSFRQTQEVLSYVRAAQERNLAIIFITHDLDQCAEIADQVLILYQGQVRGVFKDADGFDLKNWRECILGE